MSKLASTDYEGVLELVVDVARNDAFDEPLSLPTLERIRGLIPAADTVAYWVGRPGRVGTQ